MKTCPNCGSDNLLVYERTAYDVNTGHFYCHSSKTHDDDAECHCMGCDWEGKRRDLKEEQ